MNRIKTITPRSASNETSNDENPTSRQKAKEVTEKQDLNVKFTFTKKDNKKEESSRRQKLIKELAANILELNALRTRAEKLENEIKTTSMDRFDSHLVEVICV